MRLSDIDDFTRHYLIAALWSTNDESTPSGGEPMDQNYDLSDLAPETVARADKDCREFQTSCADLLIRAYEFYVDSGRAAHPDAGSPEACAGHDFWLTRNHHGVGFWDRGMGDLGDDLTTAAHDFPEVDLYVGDDGKIHSM